MTGIIVFILRILLAASLYAFLILALYTLWSELRANQRLAAGHKPPPLAIRVLEGDLEATHQFNLSQILIGRDPGCELVIANELVSAQHARLSYHHNQWWVEDLQSTNGTFLNDERVYTPTVLVDGDELRCGKINLQVAFGDHQAAYS
jgi:pSer/pThr/pTyr-binding forkhead associated (FHA) protein